MCAFLYSARFVTLQSGEKMTFTHKVRQVKDSSSSADGSPGGGNVGATTCDFCRAGGRWTGTWHTLGNASMTDACSSGDTGVNCITHKHMHTSAPATYIPMAGCNVLGLHNQISSLLVKVPINKTGCKSTQPKVKVELT